MDSESGIQKGEQWEQVGDIEVRRRLSIADTSYFYDEPVLILLSAGIYQVAVRYISPGGHRHITDVRVVHSKLPFAGGGVVGNVLVDFGQIGICDRDAVEAVFEGLGDDGMPHYFDQLNTTALVEWIQLAPSVKMLLVRPGFGDGTFPVQELLGADGTRAGVEIHCLHSVTI